MTRVIGILALVATAAAVGWAVRGEYDKAPPRPPRTESAGAVEVTWELQSANGAQIMVRNLGPNTIRDLVLLMAVPAAQSGFVDTEHPAEIRARPLGSETILTLWKDDRRDLFFSEPPGAVPAALRAEDGDGHSLEVRQRITGTPRG